MFDIEQDVRIIGIYKRKAVSADRERGNFLFYKKLVEIAQILDTSTDFVLRRNYSDIIFLDDILADLSEIQKLYL